MANSGFENLLLTYWKTKGEMTVRHSSLCVCITNILKIISKTTTQQFWIALHLTEEINFIGKSYICYLVRKLSLKGTLNVLIGFLHGSSNKMTKKP